MNKPTKNFELDEMGQVSSWIRPTDQVISPDNSAELKVSGYDVGIPMQAGQGLRIGPYEMRVFGGYQPGNYGKR